MSIAVTDGRTSTTAGQTLKYVITLKNLGTAPVKGLVVTQTVPAGSTFSSADAGGVAKNGTVTWRVDVTAAGTATVHSTTKVGATPTELLRLATVACAATSATAAPIVCASHSDLLPAGAAAEAAGPAATATGGSHTWWYVGAAVVLLIIAAAAVLLVRRRKRHASGPTDEARHATA